LKFEEIIYSDLHNGVPPSRLAQQAPVCTDNVIPSSIPEIEEQDMGRIARYFAVVWFGPPRGLQKDVVYPG
jgi:hypothetical protein